MSQQLFKQDATGFRSPGEDFEEHDLSSKLPQFLVPHPSSTFYFWMDQTYLEYGIERGDLVIVDRALVPKNNDIFVISFEGKHRLKKYLASIDQDFWQEREIFGVITFVITPHRYKRFSA